MREIDRENRSFAVVGDGQRFNLTVGHVVVNYDQIEVGDELNVIYRESIAVGMALPENTGETIALEGAVLAPEGAMPGGAAGRVFSSVVEFISYDHRSNTALVELEDGSPSAG